MELAPLKRLRLGLRVKQYRIQAAQEPKAVLNLLRCRDYRSERCPVKEMAGSGSGSMCFDEFGE